MHIIDYSNTFFMNIINHNDQPYVQIDFYIFNLELDTFDNPIYIYEFIFRMVNETSYS